MSSSEVIREGYLEKRRPTRVPRIWKKRYFVLRSSFLFYYDTETAFKKGKPPLGVIELSDEKTKIVNDVGDFYKRSYVFEIKTGKKTYPISGRSKGEMSAWIEDLNKIINGVIEVKRTDSLEIEKSRSISKNGDSPMLIRKTSSQLQIQRGERLRQLEETLNTSEKIKSFICKSPQTNPSYIATIDFFITTLTTCITRGKNGDFDFLSPNKKVDKVEEVQKGEGSGDKNGSMRKVGDSTSIEDLERPSDRRSKSLTTPQAEKVLNPKRKQSLTELVPQTLNERTPNKRKESTIAPPLNRPWLRESTRKSFLEEEDDFSFSELQRLVEEEQSLNKKKNKNENSIRRTPYNPVDNKNIPNELMEVNTEDFLVEIDFEDRSE